MTTLPANLAALRDEAMRISCISWALQCRWAIARAGIDRAGPCPVCGGTDRFSIHTTKNTFNCRKCGIAGVGVIDLVMRTQDVEFVAACEIITGRKASEPIDEQRAAENRRAAELAEAKRVREAEQYRLAARKDGFAIFEAAQPVIHGQASVVWDYLARRGIRLEAAIAAGCDPFRLRLWVIEAHPWREKQGSTYATLHTGPAMIAVLRRPESVAGASPRPFEAFGAVHQTWIDLSQPKGRLVLPDDADGKQRRTKKMRGSKTGCAMRLYTPDSPKRIVMGEGVETTLTALAWDFQPDTAYWAGGDLGNMSGRAARGEKWLHAVPDLEDRDCFLPPDWCEELVYLAENDGEESHSVEKAIRGLRRAQTLREEARAENPALRALEIGYVEPPPGGDLNDLVRESPDASPGGAG